MSLLSLPALAFVNVFPLPLSHFEAAKASRISVAGFWPNLTEGTQLSGKHNVLCLNSTEGPGPAPLKVRESFSFDLIGSRKRSQVASFFNNVPISVE